MTMEHVIGIFAHVDAGKTTLSEQLLMHAGVLRRAGRVDHADTFLDAHPLERQRGITIFSDQAVFQRDGDRFFWVDTPGHTDLIAEAERAMSVVDLAVLVVSAAEGVQSHTEALWALMKAYNIPVMVFINKIDRAGCDPDAVFTDMKRRLSPDMTDMHTWHGGTMPAPLAEAVAERDEALLDRWLEDAYEDELWLNSMRRQIQERSLFPVYRGSALNDEGVAEFLDALCLLTAGIEDTLCDAQVPFQALVYKVRRDAQNNRICFFKVLSGCLRPRQEFCFPGGTARINELRLYSGTKFTPVPLAVKGMLCATAGLEQARPGDWLGEVGGRNAFRSEPMLSVSVLWDSTIPSSRVLSALRQLEDEDPTLSVSVREATGGIDLRVMGPIQLEVLRHLAQERYDLSIDFGPMRVLYMETIDTPAVGVGHYEPLRHYAEVQLRLVPGPRGSGIHFESHCHVDELALNWQRLIETHVYEKAHKGVLTGAPLTDVTIQLLHGRAHIKHTEGGDFRESTYRAIRNALMYAHSVLLEPICRFTLTAPQSCFGRVMGDLNRMSAQTEPPQLDQETFSVTGEVAFAAFSDYHTDFLAATHGRGRMRYRLKHYAPCSKAEAVIEDTGYDPLADDPPHSVFCTHGAGVIVPWNEVRNRAHCPVEADDPE